MIPTDHHPPDCLTTRDGRLFIEDCDTVALVEEFGSPIFAFSERQITENYTRFRDAFAAGWEHGPVDVMPAMKANTILAIRRLLTNLGAGADLYSPEELEGALRTGVDPERTSANGGGKSREHLRRCIEAGVRITVEDLHEIDWIQEEAAALGATARIRLRVKPALPNLWRRTDFSQLWVPIDLGVQVYKSGIPPEYLVDLGRKAFAAPNVELVGLHFHAGRHHPSLWFWQGMMVRFARLVGELCRAWDGWKPQEIDIGGGMASRRDPHNKEFGRWEFLLTAAGYPFLVGLRGLGEQVYHTLLGKIVNALREYPDPRGVPTIEQYAATITGTLSRELQAQGVALDGVRLQTEPGRSLYGDTAVHLSKVKVVKEQTQPIPYTWVLLDTTYFFLAGGVYEKNRHPYLVANKADEPADLLADIVGHSCYADQIVLGAKLPRVEPGDVMAILEAGAYQESSASNFNALPRPATVLVRGDRAELIKRSETIDEIYGRDIVPARLGEQGAGA
ncbi:MAG: alanine racemase [Actinobacteria bacterium]|nr:alanine racemase [Actinomycetota bacterium]